ncbi:MAG TPA: LPS export ABC transporter periplasmic protein LptC [Telluria sp.]|nr:LPS export ABC transporter periplasmic protein LptC [Telluria sp.]
MARQYRKRTAHRWRFGAVLGACLALALGSFYIVQLMNVADMEMLSDAHKGEPDYIVENFSAVRMTPQGTPRYIVSGARMSHIPINDSSLVERPTVQSFAPNKPPLVITSKNAQLDHVNNTVDLIGNVDVQRAGSATTKPLTIETEALTIFADEDRMQTALPVTVTSGASVVRGAGMMANNATRQIQIRKARVSLPAQ